MEKYFVLILAGFLFVSFAYSKTLGNVAYTCKDHPEVKVEVSGNCTSCGQALQPVSENPDKTTLSKKPKWKHKHFGPRHH